MVGYNPEQAEILVKWLANQRIEYGMPEPYAHDRRTWIDNSTDPISVRYADYQGYIVRIQPLD